MAEFSIIAKYFSRQEYSPGDVLLGIGDDAGIVDSTGHDQLAISVDTLNAGVHFPLETSPYDIGWKSLAVNLSDMAAMGAKPLWFTLAISLPDEKDKWLAEFARGLFEIANKYNVKLIGGDTTQGPLSISIQITGAYTGQGKFQRNAAKPGDLIYVTGFIGDAALGLLSLNKDLPLSFDEKYQLLKKLSRPEPRVKEALAFSHFINAAIDISDGLYADLNHILKLSGVGAEIFVNQLPISRIYRWVDNSENMYDLALTGGDDYELCVTISPENEQAFIEKAAELNCRISKVGEITDGDRLELLKLDKSAYELHKNAYEHFA